MTHCYRFSALLCALAIPFLCGCATLDPTSRALDLAAGLADGELKDRLLQCDVRRFEPVDFSISHRGAPLGYPEHTKEGYLGAIKMGAGIIECDVTFTRDLELVCRHSQCDLHRTTNVLQTPLAAQCNTPFTGATTDNPALARCCTSDLSLAEFRTLCGRRDIVDPTATNVADYLTEPESVVVDAPITCGTLLTHRESIELIDGYGRSFIPELKRPEVAMPFAPGFDQQAYASKMLAEYTDAGIAPERVYPQSFDRADVEYWIAKHPDFAANSVYLDGRGRNPAFAATLEDMQAIKRSGINIIAPPIPMLLRIDAAGELQASKYAELANAAGLDIVTWTFESGLARLPGYVTNDAKMLEVLHALHTEVGIRGIFSDWPGTVTYYANCWGVDT